MGKKDIKPGLMLLSFFIKIGCFTFGGGWSILAQIEREFIDRRQMITKDELLELTAVGRSLPGIMITNISMLFGYQLAGWFGGVCAVVGIVIPPMVILSLLTVFYDAVKANFWCACALRGVQCAVVPIIASAAISLGREGLKTRLAKCICLAALVLVLLGVGNVILVALGVLGALIWMGVEKYDPA